MTASYEARDRCEYPAYQDCLKALAEASAAVQVRRHEGRSEDEAPASGAA